MEPEAKESAQATPELQLCWEYQAEEISRLYRLAIRIGTKVSKLKSINNAAPIEESLEAVTYLDRFNQNTEELNKCIHILDVVDKELKILFGD